MSFKDMTPEQRAAAAIKAVETKRRKREEQRAALVLGVPADEAPPADMPDASEPVAEDHLPTPYDIFLASLDAETRSLLADAELRAIFAASEQKAADEKRARLQKAAADRALHHAKANAGLLPKEAVANAEWRRRMDEKVTFTPHLPESCYIEHFGCPCLVVDGKMYQDGVQVTTTRGEYMSFREMVWRNQQAELDFEGRSRLHHLRRDHFAGLNTQVSLA